MILKLSLRVLLALAALFAPITARAASEYPLVITGGHIGQLPTGDSLKLRITGSTQCLHVDTSGVITGTGSDCGSGAGSVTSVICGTGLTGGTITSTGTCAVNSTVLMRTFGTTFGDTAGSALTSGSTVYFTVPYACTISAWNIAVDAGTVTLDVWKIATGTAIPTISNTITASAKPALSTGTALHSTSMSSWTTSVTADDIFAIKLDTVATAKFVSFTLECGL